MTEETKTTKPSESLKEKATALIGRFRDVRTVGVAVFAVLLALVVWNGAKAVQANYELQKQIATLQTTNETKRLQNANLELTNHYYETSQYLEVTARQNLGLAAPGETVLLVPESVARANTVPDEGGQSEEVVNEADRHFWQRNFRAWMDFFFHRNNNQPV